MNRTAAAALADADLVVFVVEALRFGEEDEAVLQRIRDSGRESIVVINKVDKVPQKDKLLPFIAELAAKHGFLDVVPVSAEKNVNLDRLIDVIAARLPESPELFPPEQRTDRGIEFQISETIREKLTMVTPSPLPSAFFSIRLKNAAHPIRKDEGEWAAGRMDYLAATKPASVIRPLFRVSSSPET